LAFWLLRYKLQLYARAEERNAGVWNDQEPAYMGGYAPRPLDFAQAAPNLTAASSPPQALAQSRSEIPTLSAVLEKWLDERKPPDKTERDWRAAVRRFTELHGDLPVGAIEKQHVRAFKDALVKLPKNLKHNLRAKTLPEIIKATGDRPGDRLQAGGVNKYLDALGCLLTWASHQGYRDGNPVTGLKMRRPAAAGTDRQPFDLDDLKRIFDSPLYRGCKSARSRGSKGEHVFRDAKFWLPLLGLYTGARVEELAQLLVADIREQGEITHLSINVGDPATEKTLKNRSSQRDVPVHPELIRCGFLEYLQQRRQQGGDRLFPDLVRGSDSKWSSAFSKWMGRYLRETVEITDTRKVFHSFRHTFKDACRRARLSEEVHDALTGHTNGSVSRTYGAGMSSMLELLNEELSRVSSEGLNLSHLYGSQTVRKTL
jgi:integrase